MNLADILSSEQGHTIEDETGSETVRSHDGPADDDSTVVVEGNCIECGDQEAVLHCEDCREDFCEVCSTIIHRTGKRRKHTLRLLKEDVPEKRDVEMSVEPEDKRNGHAVAADEEMEAKLTVRNLDAEQTERIKQRARFIPLRLTAEERKLHRLLEAALNVSEYTDKIDVISYVSKSRRIVAQLKEICAILSGLMVAQDFKAGQALINDRDYTVNAELYKTIFEIGRRYKIMNPDRMRGTYGKMMFMIQDSLIPEVSETLGFDLFKPVLTVHNFLQAREGLAVLEDDQILTATMEIVPDNKTRPMIQSEIKAKERAIESLCRKYSSGHLLKEDLRQCLYSIGDASAYLRANRDPVMRMRELLFRHFSPDKPDRNLAIRAGVQGSRLTHSHRQQFEYASQTLILWGLIMENMFELYLLVDADMLSTTSRYRLMDTGQGLNRVQACPTISRRMHSILAKAQGICGHWVGSSAIHLGDRSVPNALVFIDKYAQIPRILTPLYTSIAALPSLGKDPFVSGYLDEAFGGVDELAIEILRDWARNALDGSGALNNIEAGSCIDGRTTSLWNWCHGIHGRPYFKALLLVGFPGFDGSGFSG
ncbi:hypothetical protein BCR37DRAFT_403316 [Protomyces lactucae-debilis]|uniref:B box-type domain-containing protein n=1 Tax=Protomyces lactucae-debilis TaxID=2754530 RepID=A0A1Y2F513_PROLT|nr:uncharacterized protein BCR37DRAFT_403316 [Protomyces lactucae-debilis]ORY79000.1 hypothetical protein BCR37DRAFT_403316 [Protomyces lactucae-debilis]